MFLTKSFVCSASFLAQLSFVGMILIASFGLLGVPVQAAPIYSCPSGSSIDASTPPQCFTNVISSGCPTGFTVQGSENCVAPANASCADPATTLPNCDPVVPAASQTTSVIVTPQAATSTPTTSPANDSSLTRSGGAQYYTLPLITAAVLGVGAILSWLSSNQSRKDSTH